MKETINDTWSSLLICK